MDAVFSNTPARAEGSPASRRRSGGRLRARPLIFSLLAAVALVLGGPSARAGSCDGIVDFSDELVPRELDIVSETPIGDGLSELEVSFDLENQDGGDFVSARAFPVLDDAAAALGIEAIVEEATFEAIPPFGRSAATRSLRLRLPSANVAAAFAELEAGTLPLVVHALEREVLAPGVFVTSWTAAEDAYYAYARDNSTPAVNLDPGPSPYAPGAEFAIVLVALGDGMGSVFDAFDPSETLFIIPDGYVPLEIPEALHYMRVVAVAKSDEGGTGLDASDGVTTWSVSLKRTDTELLPTLYTSASFCTGTDAHIDLPVQASRLFTIDGETQEEEDRDSQPQPVLWNDEVGTDVVSLSGQVAGHVLKPSLEIRLRDGAVRVVADIETDLSFTAELRGEVTDSFTKEIELLDHCFPLPELVLGPVKTSMTLELTHGVTAEGSVTAGAITGIQKRFQAGYSVGYDDRRAGDPFFSEPRFVPNPVDLTPPQLTEETGIELSLSTEIRTTLRVGNAYPDCGTGAGAYLGTRATAGLSVEPTQDPWWSVGHDAEIFSGIDMEILGFPISEHHTLVEFFSGDESLDAGDGLAPGSEKSRLAGEDQRWAFAIDRVGVPNAIRHTDVAALAGGRSALVLEEKVGGRDALLLVDAFGQIESSVEYAGVRSPKRVIVLPDDTLLVAGDPAWVARHADDGTLLESWDFDVTDDPTGPLDCVIRSAAAIEESPGRYGFVAVGHHGRGDVRDRDACAFRADASGGLLWARTYGEDGAQEFLDVLQAANGELVAVGETETGPTPLAEGNPLVARLDVVDGSVLWARSLPMIARGAKLNAVVEAADGTLYAAGAAARPIGRTGAALIARLDPDGQDVRHALVLQDLDWEALQPSAAYFETAGGDTAFDEIFDLASVPGGVVFAGRTGLGTASAGWVGRLNEGLGLEWFRVFDGLEGDTLDGIALTEGGYLVSGYSRSLARNLEESDTQGWLMKLAFEGGGSDLLPDAGLETRLLAAGLRGSSGDDAIVPIGGVAIDAPLVETDALADSTSSAIVDLLDPPTDLCVTQLSGSGHDTDADACQPVPEPGFAFALTIGGLAVAGTAFRRDRGLRGRASRHGHSS